ncbi:hypothetical protein K0H59_05030 [Shewanella sp. FJAT-51649]|uniref:hypothetical protein n=1 Tax=Shewanella sp. FJAT-51649 TaxID=2864210 RepID=UPI001C659DE0|nr:hypothetical protein [Shewanella sp. FJAT-51649]QYJ72423.1 hypothetical protein K0H59_05030 [Shewanella sp. FJAT-51649]
MASNVFISYCNHCIAELERMKRIYPEEHRCLERLIKQWQQTKQRLIARKNSHAI